MDDHACPIKKNSIYSPFWRKSVACGFIDSDCSVSPSAGLECDIVGAADFVAMSNCES